MQAIAESPSVDRSSSFRRVLVPVDFTIVGHRAVYAALELRHACGSHVCLFNLTHLGENDRYLAHTGMPTTPGDLIEHGCTALRRFVENIAPGQADAVEIDVQVGTDLVQAIRDKASTWAATLVVLSHEHHAALLRTRSEKITRALDVDVLLIQ